ncbi:MAG: TetR/AcrR family transcriptional regulator [Acidobacteria bacterium]|nr:TetR/AcrR family transcriptional regulator [Acidobacteriota bacterium]
MASGTATEHAAEKPAAPRGQRSPSRTEVRQRQTRIRLREVAHQLMTSQGVDATTIQRITDAADIGFGTFYNYYPTKEALAEDVLDCLINNLGQRNDLVTEVLGETDPVRIVANSVRFVMRETVTNPVYHWWFEHLDLLVARMRAGFGPFGMRDIRRAVDHGVYHIVEANHSLAWGQLVWMMACGAKDIIAGVHDLADERAMVEGVLRVMGVDHHHAHLACDTELPEVPPLPIDFAFGLDD